MKKIITLAIFLCASAASAVDPVPPTSALGRQLIKAGDAGTMRGIIGVAPSDPSGFVPRSGTNMTGRLTNTHGFVGDGSLLVNLPSSHTNVQAVAPILYGTNYGVFNVKDYGAVLTDGADDSEALGRAIQALTNNGGGVLYFPHGTCRTTNPIVFTAMTGEGAFSTVTFRGQSRGGSVLSFSGISNQVAITSWGSVINIEDMSIVDAGGVAKTNTGYLVMGGGGSGVWKNALFKGWGNRGADMNYVADGRIFACVFSDNRIGLRLPGYSDCFFAQIRCDRNLVGLELGGTTTPETVRSSTGGNYYVGGTANKYDVVVGKGSGNYISPSSEGYSNCVVAIGHPPDDFPAAELDDYVGVTRIGDFYTLNTGQPAMPRPVIKLFVECDQLILENISPGGAPVLVKSMISATDNTRITYRGVQMSGGKIPLETSTGAQFSTDPNEIAFNGQINGQFAFSHAASGSTNPIFKLTYEGARMSRAVVTNILELGTPQPGDQIIHAGTHLSTRDDNQNVYQFRSGAAFGELGIWGSYVWFGSHSAIPVYFQIQDVPRWVMNTSGHLTPFTPYAYDFGSTGNPVRTVYVSPTNGVRFATDAGPRIVSGDGSPEGVVAAPKGAIYLRTDGGAGTGFYVKETGAGNTGWIAK